MAASIAIVGTPARRRDVEETAGLRGISHHVADLVRQVAARAPGTESADAAEEQRQEERDAAADLQEQCQQYEEHHQRHAAADRGARERGPLGEEALPSVARRRLDQRARFVRGVSEVGHGLSAGAERALDEPRDPGLTGILAAVQRGPRDRRFGGHRAHERRERALRAQRGAVGQIPRVHQAFHRARVRAVEAEHDHAARRIRGRSGAEREQRDQHERAYRARAPRANLRGMGAGSFGRA
jgi:hypothetical protein